MREYEIAAEGEYRREEDGSRGDVLVARDVRRPEHGPDDAARLGQGREERRVPHPRICDDLQGDTTQTSRRRRSSGSPSAAQKRLYTATYDAYSAALKATRPGATTLELRDAAEEVVDEYGYSQYSFSRIQPILHGVGMNVYEPPWAPEPGMDEPSAELKAGHVIAIEPCITLDDNLEVGGCRIGETILVTETGYELLTDGKPGPTIHSTRASQPSVSGSASPCNPAC